MNVRYGMEIDKIVAKPPYSRRAVRSFLFDVNLALAAVIRLRNMGPWGRTQLLAVDPSGSLLDDECPAGYAALSMLRYTIERGGESRGIRPIVWAVPGLKVIKRPNIYSKAYMSKVRREREAERIKRMSEKEVIVRIASTQWLPHHLRLLETMWPTHTADEIATFVPHTVGAVTRMATVLGLSRKVGYLSAAQVADDLGVHSNTVINWCRFGWLKAERSRVVRCKVGAVWEIDRDYYSNFKALYNSLPPSMTHRGPVAFKLMQKLHGVSAGGTKWAA